MAHSATYRFSSASFRSFVFIGTIYVLVRILSIATIDGTEAHGTKNSSPTCAAHRNALRASGTRRQGRRLFGKPRGRPLAGRCQEAQTFL